MAKQDNHCKTTQANYSDDAYRHSRPDPITGELNYFFPMEITDPTDRALARERGLEICRTRLGNRTFEAVMVPCRDVATIHGVEVYIDTPSEVQHRRYLEFVKDELAAQDRAKHDGRCMISNGRGGLKRCPCRVPNPDYSPDGDQRKTLPVSCTGCPYEACRQAHSEIPLSTFDRVDESGEVEEAYEAPAVRDILSADLFEAWREEFLNFVALRAPMLAPQATLRTLGYRNAEISRKLGVPSSTVTSRGEKLEDLLMEYLASKDTL